MKLITSNIGFILLAVYLILFGIMSLVAIAIPSVVIAFFPSSNMS